MITPFCYDDLAKLDLPDEVELVVKRLDGADRLSYLSGQGLCMTMWSGEVGIGIMAAAPLVCEADTCEAFIVATRDQVRHPRAFVKAAKEGLKKLQARFKHVQAIIVEDDFHTRWLTFMGFERLRTVDRPPFGKRGLWGLKERHG